MTIQNRLAPTWGVRIACLAGLGAWLCLLVGTWMKWTEILGNTAWDVALSLWLFWGTLLDAILGGAFSGNVPTRSALALEAVSLVFAIAAVLGAWRGRKEQPRIVVNLAFGLGVTLLVLAVGSLLLQTGLYLWLKDTNWR